MTKLHRSGHGSFPDVTIETIAWMYLSLGRDDLAGDILKGEYERLVSLELPNVDRDSSEFRDDYWAAELASKYPFSIPGVNREVVAVTKFTAAEEQCRLSNERLVGWDSRASLPFKELARARRLVASVLGRFSWDKALAHCAFGPGATTSLSRRQASQQQKWELATHITEGALPLFLAFREYNSGWHEGKRDITLVPGNMITTVPKNAKTDRVIAIEPDWNMFFQKGIGGLIRQRLRTCLGLLTPDAQLLNQQLAKEGSVSGSYATIDLSGASDSVSLALCELLLPSDWFRAVLQTRSPEGIVAGSAVTYEKVSSMGNGYTFELETLFFWALSKSVCGKGQIRVYGDDIIVPTEFASAVIWLLGICGFSLNAKKTFVSGPFRESCGGHFHNGAEVTPPYFRHQIRGMPEYIRTCNRIRRVASQRYGYWCDGRFEGLWSVLSSKIPKAFRGPPELGDAVLTSTFDESRPTWSRRYQTWQCKMLVPCTVDTHFDSWGGVFSSLWGKVSEESHRSDTTGAVRMARNLSGSYRWDGPSPWLGDAAF